MASADSEDPVERKVQLTGGSTYTVSLPKDWARDQGIEPGCSVTLYSQADRLVMTRGADGPDDSLTATIDASDADPAHLARCVRAAYVTGATQVQTAGPVDAERRLAVQDATSGLVGFEVDREAADDVVVRSMLDASDLSLEQTLIQMKDLGLAMHEGAVAAVVSGETDGAIARQDDAVDRLLALVSRQVQRSIAHVGASSSLTRSTAFDLYTAARQLERIADHAEKIARTAERTDDQPPADVADHLTDLGERSRSLVDRTVVVLLEGDDPASVGRIVDDADAFLADADDLDRDLYERGIPDGYVYSIVLDSLVRTAEYGVNIAETALQAAVRESGRDG